MRYQNCIFDLYGTLVDIRTEETAPGLWREMAAWYARFGAEYPPEALRAAYFGEIQAQEAALRAACPEGYPEIQIEPVFRRLFAGKGVAAGPELTARTGRRFRQASLRHLRLYDGAEAMLKALRANGQGVWLLSNAQRVFTARELDALGITGLFDGIYLSSDCGWKKPDPRFFRRLLDERAIDPATAVMVGNDGACDVAGARAVGLATVYVRSDISPAEPLPQADYVLPEMDLRRVLAILTQR